MNEEVLRNIRDIAVRGHKKKLEVLKNQYFINIIKYIDNVLEEENGKDND